MLPAVCFDNDPSLIANKIYNELIYRLLSSELQPIELLQPEMLPQQALSIGRAFA